MESVELRPAYAWDCPNCYKTNFENGLVAEMSPEEEQELKIEAGLDLDTVGDWMMIPEIVHCQFCGNEFKSISYKKDIL